MRTSAGRFLSHLVRRRAALLVLPALLPLLASCQARRDFPDPNAGYHNGSFTIVFGRLVREAAPNPDDPPTWVVRFGVPSDPYKGELALNLASKPQFTNGYVGGEPVEIHGHLYDQPSNDAYNGRWYDVDSMRLWTGYRE